MKLLLRAAVGLLLASVGGCRTSSPNDAPKKAAAATSATAVPAVSGSAGVQEPPVPSQAALVAALPKLKPIAPKPFPEGATEEMVCDAIDSNEPDLWVRFGHLVPAYITGAVYILETGPEMKDRLYKYIGSDYVYGYHSQMASCRGELTLLYIREMFDKSEYKGRPFGREHLSEALEKKFGIKTRASFQLQSDRQRLSDYCRADAELCEQLVKLDRSDRGEGLCGWALSKCNPGGSSADALRRCRTVPRKEISCTMFVKERSEARQCEDHIRSLLCP